MSKIKFYIKRLKEGSLKSIWQKTIWIYSYAHRYWKQMIFYTVLGLMGTVISLISSLISRNMVDIVTGMKTGLLLQTFCFYIGFSVGNLFLSQLSAYFSNKISLGVENEIKQDVFYKMLCVELESIQKYHTGDLLTRWSSDVGNIASGILNWIPNFIIYSVRFLSTFALVFYNDAMFAFLALLGAPVSLLMSHRRLGKMTNNNQRSAAINAKMSGFHQEAFSNIQTIKAFNLIDFYTERLKALQEEYFHMRLDYQKMSMVNSILLSVVGLIVSYSCYGFGIYRVWSGAISYGTMTMFLSLSGSLTGNLNQLVSLVSSAVSLMTSAGRLMDILDMPSENFEQKNKVHKFLEQNKEDGISIFCSDVSYRYHTGTEVFYHMDFEAHPHEIIALVGPSGEGKTTMLRLLLALLKPQEGTCFFIGEKNKALLENTPAARVLFSYVPQGNTMFSGTIAENMRFVKPEATEEEIEQVLKLACAWSFVEKLPNGMNSSIGERGNGFSEGQAQRLSIARALLLRAPILIMDEATSALDVVTEREVLKNIMKDEYPRTCILTTHRPTVLGMCKRVYGIREKKCVILNAEEINALMDDF